jgi:hypothetical protein
MYKVKKKNPNTYNVGYDWNRSSCTQFKACDNNICIKKGIKKIFNIIDHISRFIKNVGRVFVTQNNFVIEALQRDEVTRGCIKLLMREFMICTLYQFLPC